MVLQHNMLQSTIGTSNVNLDAVDLRILNELQRDSSLSNLALAQRVHLSPSPCLARVKALQACGVIRQYVAQLDAKQLGLDLNVFISVSHKHQTRAALETFEAQVSAREEVMECYLMSGNEDYLLRVVVSDIPALERFILEQLSPMAEVDKIRSSFALKQVRYKTALPLRSG
jgi:DNA-binding Lrp family transcriptional regulator